MCIKTNDFKPFRIRTYAKTGEGGVHGFIQFPHAIARRSPPPLRPLSVSCLLARAGVLFLGLSSPCIRKEASYGRSEEHTSELQSQSNLVCRLLLEKKK